MKRRNRVARSPRSMTRLREHGDLVAHHQQLDVLRVHCPGFRRLSRQYGWPTGSDRGRSGPESKIQGQRATARPSGPGSSHAGSPPGRRLVLRGFQGQKRKPLLSASGSIPGDGFIEGDPRQMVLTSHRVRASAGPRPRLGERDEYAGSRLARRGGPRRTRSPPVRTGWGGRPSNRHPGRRHAGPRHARPRPLRQLVITPRGVEILRRLAFLAERPCG
jgi:hypothetical protein